MNSSFELSLAFHLLGVVLWLGGVMIVTRLLLVRTPLSAEQGKAVVRIYLGFGVGGAVLTWLAGIFQLMMRGMAFYGPQGWFHAKTTFALLLLVATLAFIPAVFRAARGEVLAKKWVLAVHALAGLTLVLGIFLTQLGRVVTPG